MLILPIINNNRIMNVELKIKTASKIKKNVSYEDAFESDIVVNREKYIKSLFAKSKEENAPIEFIRSKSIIHPRNFLVVTKRKENNKYDIYNLEQPPKKVNDGLDILYSKAITDLRQEIPDKTNRGRYVSLEEIGLNKELTNEKISKLQEIVKESKNDHLEDKLKEAGVLDLKEILEFFNIFQCMILSDTIIPEQSLNDTLSALSNIHTRDYKNLNKYYKMAKDNTDAFIKLSFINKILYDKPLSIVHSSKEKQKVLKKEENDYGQVA